MVHLITSTAGTNKIYTQCIATIGVSLLMLQTGIMGGWTSPNMAYLTQENSTIPLTLTQASWVASNLNLGRFAGAVLVPMLIEFIGSKKTVLSVLFPILISWILLSIAYSVEWLYAARFIGGMSFGMAYGVFSIYLGEVSMPSFRGSFISMAMCGAPIGTVIGTIGETYLPMMWSSLIYIITCLVAIVIFLLLPDAPYYLVKRNDMESARKALIWYHGDHGTDEELNSIKSFVDANSNSGLKNKFKEFNSPPIRRAMILTVILFFFPQMCGLFNIMFYMEIILTKGKSFYINPKEVVIYANVIAVVSTILAIRLIDLLGRRILLMISGVGTTLAMTGLGLHFYLLDSGFDPSKLQWIPLASVLLFMITFTIGFMTVPSTVLSEIFPASVKSVAACVASFTAAFFGFVAAKAYQPMIDAIGEAYVFWIHAGFSILAVPCALFLLPETKGKTFQEIQDKFFKK